MRGILKKWKNSKGFISLDTLVTAAIILGLGIAIMVIFNLKGGETANISNQKIDTASTDLGGLTIGDGKIDGGGNGGAGGDAPGDGTGGNVPDGEMCHNFDPSGLVEVNSSDVLRKKIVEESTYYFMRDGSVKADGPNNAGQAGIGKESAWVNEPTTIKGLNWKDVAEIMGFAETRILIKKDGDVLVWGNIDGMPNAPEGVPFYTKPTQNPILNDMFECGGTPPNGGGVIEN